MRKIVFVGILLAAGGCGLAVALARPDWLGFGPERAVRKRAEGYWNARVAGDLKEMAPFIHPLQKTIQENSLLVTESYEITGVHVEGNEARIGIHAKYRLLHPKMSKLEREITHEDLWVRYKGQWYHSIYPVSFGELLEQGLGKWKPPVNPGGETDKTAP